MNNKFHCVQAGQYLIGLLTRSSHLYRHEFIELGETYLRSLGVTRQKAHYLVQLSSAILRQELNFRKLVTMNDEDARMTLMRIKGIGAWSADVYLLMAMRRADVWPAGDLALAVAIQELNRYPQRPTILQNWNSMPNGGDLTVLLPHECSGNIISHAEIPKFPRDLLFRNR